MDPEQPSPEHLILLNEVYGAFSTEAAWPVCDYLDRRLDQRHGLVIGDLFTTVPEGLLRIYTPIRDNTDIMVRIAGMLYCDGAEGDVELFVRALRWCVAREASFAPSSPTMSEQLNVPTAEVAEDWAKDGITTTPLDFEKLRCMFIAEWVDVSISGTPSNWRWTIPKNIRRFRTVRNVYDYLRVIEQDSSQPLPANPLVHPAPGPMIVAAPQEQVRVVGGASPSDDAPADATLEVASLHPLVRTACAELFTGGHYRQGVLDAALALRDLVREKSGLSESNDRTLMGKALAGRNPRIIVSDAPGKQGASMREGTAYLALGIVSRLRNVLTHEKVEVPPYEAIEMVGTISRVVRDIEAGRVAEEQRSC